MNGFMRVLTSGPRDDRRMLGAYGWAYIKLICKLYYNMTITSVSVVIALLVGGIEALGLIGEKMALNGGFWVFIASLSDNFGALGFIIGIFGLAVWTVSYLGLLPAVGLLRPATEQPPRRNALMITAHVVWGSSMGLALARLERGSRQR